MKVLLLTDVNSPHSIKWLCGLRDSGIEVSCFSLRVPEPAVVEALHGVRLAYFRAATGGLGKLSYFAALPKLRSFVAKVRPDVLHAHYASSYGLLGAICGFQPFCISVWGSDVYEFPRLGLLQEQLLRFALSRAVKCFSTSKHMATETAKYRKARIEVIAFGVDTARFKPKNPKPTGTLNFATAKSLQPIYNIDAAVQSFAQLLNDAPNLPISLHVAGDGPEMSRCKTFAGTYLNRNIYFHGRVAHEAMPAFFADKHVLINIPDTESFGVSVVEASAAGLAIIATRTGGLPEVVKEGTTGWLIDLATGSALQRAIMSFVDSPELASKMGATGMLFAERHYPWEASVLMQMTAYEGLLSKS